jgi:DNA recombination protein RmuC
MPDLLLPLLALCLGALITWLIMRTRIATLEATRAAEQAAVREQRALLEGAEAKLRDAFGALSAQALAANNQAFLELARTSLGEAHQAARTDLDARQLAIDAMLKPLQDGLVRVDETLQKVNVDRAESHGALQENLRLMLLGQQQLTGETAQLVRALRAPQVRGQWGELQLRRVVELAGMIAHCDFVEQESVGTSEGLLRPDLVVRLPGDKVIVVDAKAPLAAYLDANDALDDAARGAALDRHAKQVREHITQLSAKNYAAQFTAAPDFVILFLPGEAFFSAACQRDPSLIEFAVGRGVIPASPTTLITVLKAVAYGWQQERVAANAEQIRDLGIELHGRMRVVAEHLDKVRRGLEAAVGGYNQAVGSLESRVLPTVRRFRDLGAGEGGELLPLAPVESAPRLAAAPELVEEGGGQRDR